MSPFLYFMVLCVSFFGISNGLVLAANTCGTLEDSCKCGNDTVPTTWTVPVCPKEDKSQMGLFIHGEFPSFDEYCANFQTCSECYPNGNLSCKSCSPQTFGRFCEKECDCQNGGSCDAEGKCLCPAGYEGSKCEALRCGQPYTGKTPLIKYGNVSEIGQWPWQAALFRCGQYGDDKECYFKCGGSLLNELWVMTAAHCLTGWNATTDVTPKQKIKVYLGKYYMDNSKDDKYVQEKKIDAYYLHYKFTRATLESDIALIKLKTPVQMNVRVQPVCLPTLQTSELNIIHGKTGVVTGWGRNEYNNLRETIEQAVVPVLGRKYCKLATSKYELTEDMFCTGSVGPNAAGVYKGDSGGPIVFPDPFANRTRWIVEGVVSRINSIRDKIVQPVDVSVYTTVSHFLDWIVYHVIMH